MSLGPSGGWELRRHGAAYPECVARSPDPPATLFGMGDRSLLRPGLAVVGSRRATPYGTSCARMFAGWAAAQGVVIVSGAAAGCDRAAHEAAIEEGGRTVAVLGCGADVDYPSGSAGLLATLRDTGAVISELDWGTQPKPFAFPRRNRIIAALSEVVLIVEAGLPSGTFSTADHALAAGREVVAVPGSIFFANSRGCNRLISQGAHSITDVSDLAAVLRDAGLIPHAPAQEVTGPHGSHPIPCADLSSLDPALRRLASALLADPMRPDDAARALAADIVTVARHLSLLESRGIVARYPDGRYGACAPR